MWCPPCATRFASVRCSKSRRKSCEPVRPPGGFSSRTTSSSPPPAPAAAGQQECRPTRHESGECRSAMRTEAQAVIIGGGVAGCSVAYHLTLMGWREIVLLEKGQLTGGATFHTAGLIGQLRGSHNLTRMIMYSVELYARLREETGLDPDWRRVGSLRLASSERRMEELRRQAALAKAYGLELELIGPREALRLFPIMSDRDLVGAAY